MSSLPLAESRLWDKYTQIILLHSQGSTLDLDPVVHILETYSAGNILHISALICTLCAHSYIA